MFIDDKLSFNNNMIASSDNKQIIIDINVVAETMIQENFLRNWSNPPPKSFSAELKNAPRG